MRELCYDIRMRVPIGIRIGVMTMEVNDSDVPEFSQYLAIPVLFPGRRTSRIIWRFSRTIQSLLKEIHYVASGSYTENELPA